MPTTVNLHEAKTHLSRLVDRAAKGQEFIIAKAGKPMVRVIAIAPVSAERQLGFFADRGVLKTELKQPFAADIDAMFGGT